MGPRGTSWRMPMPVLYVFSAPQNPSATWKQDSERKVFATKLFKLSSWEAAMILKTSHNLIPNPRGPSARPPMRSWPSEGHTHVDVDELGVGRLAPGAVVADGDHRPHPRRGSGGDRNPAHHPSPYTGGPFLKKPMCRRGCPGKKNLPTPLSGEPKGGGLV